jgi:prepilin-type N-terminal cleavage/methylation domain-containing protein
MSTGRQGFTLIEVIVVIAIVAILSAILTPTITKNIDDSKRARAVNECQVIAASATSFYKDMGMWPARANATDNYLYLLYGDGRIPANAGGGSQYWTGLWGAGREDTFTNQLIANTPTATGTPYPSTGDLSWRGPYATEYKADPWGNRYALNVAYLHMVGLNNAAWVLCAGPNNQVETVVNQNVVNPVVGGDDIVGRLK